MDDVREVDVAAARADEVARADPVAVTVTAEREHRLIRVRETRAGRDRQNTTVQRVKTVGVDVVRSLAGATDTREHCDLVRVELELREGHLDARQDAEVTTVVESR